MEENVLKNIADKLDIIIKLLVNQAISEKKDIDSTVFLSNLGLTNKEIASLLNVKSNVVSARLSEAKKRMAK
jgi:DNA-directed RNA polymerase specialized sigma24 family protein